MTHRSQSRGPQRPSIGQDVKEQLAGITEQLNRIEWKIGRSFHGIMESVDEIGEDIMTELSDAIDAIEAAAEADTSADSAAKDLLVKLSVMVGELKAGVTDPAQVARITAFADTLKANAASLAEAVVANTPAADAPPAEEPPVDTGGSVGGIGSTGGV